MVKRIAALLVLLIVAGGLSVVSADGLQQSLQPQPAILRFAVDVPSITVAETETQQVTALFTWQLVDMVEPYRLNLESYRLDSWQSMIAYVSVGPDVINGQSPFVIEHPLNFGPPTYRLSIVDERGRTVDQRLLVVPYAEDEGAVPEITDFTTGISAINPDALAQQDGLLRVQWQVSNRISTSNLIFEQLLEVGSASVELPRMNRWVPSAGEGPIRPVIEPGATAVNLRLRLVDLTDESVLDEHTLMIPIAAGAPVPTAAPPTAAPVSGPETSAPPVISGLIAAPNPVERGGTVTISWDVQNASSVAVYRTNPIGQFADFLTDQPGTGSWTVQLPGYHVDQAMFYLEATGQGGRSANATVTVQVNCPYSYFFGPSGLKEGCPLAEAKAVPAALQPFEHGTLIWRGDTGTIYELSEAGYVTRLRDTWVEGTEVSFSEAPPAGLLMPTRGFGKAWVENTFLRGRLGWATAPEQGYTMQVQQSGAYRYPYLYMTGPDGRVFYIVETQWGFLD